MKPNCSPGEANEETTGPIDAAVTNEPEPPTAGVSVASDGAVLGRDFVIPGVGPGDNDPTSGTRDRSKTTDNAIEIVDVVGSLAGPGSSTASTWACRTIRSRWCWALGHRQERADQAHRRAALPRPRRRDRQGDRFPTSVTTTSSRCARSSACSSRTGRSSAR